MIDRQARDRYAELLRHFGAGLITNDEYEDEAYKLPVGDPALRHIWSSVWFAYSDLSTHYLKGKHALTKEGRRHFARAIVFLYSDFEYEYSDPGMASCLINLLTLGLWYRLGYARQPKGEQSLWPFFRKSDYETMLSCPRLLAGAK